MLSSLLAGILAAFTPCVLVLFPSLVWRVSLQEEKPVRFTLLFTAGFISLFVILGLLVSEVLSSSAKYGFQLGIGLIFITLGILSLLKRFNPLDFPLIKNPLLYGIVFAIIAAVNPCSTAYLGVILTSSTKTIMSMFLFGIGILLPAALFALFGSSVMAKVQKTRRFMHYLTNVMNVLLIAMGVYLIINITTFGKVDVWLAAIMLSVVFLIILRATYLFKRKINLATLLLFIVLLAIIIAAITHCDNYIEANKEPTGEAPFISFSTDTEQAPACSEHIEDCEICTKCISLFVGAALIGTITIILEWLLYKRNTRKKSQKEKK